MSEGVGCGQSPDEDPHPVQSGQRAELIGERTGGDLAVERDKNHDSENPSGEGAPEGDDIGEVVLLQKNLQRGEQLHEHEGKDDEGDVTAVALVKAGPMRGINELEHGVMHQLDRPNETKKGKN